jgi:hypothetical protein
LKGNLSGNVQSKVFAGQRCKGNVREDPRELKIVRKEKGQDTICGKQQKRQKKDAAIGVFRSIEVYLD